MGAPPGIVVVELVAGICDVSLDCHALIITHPTRHESISFSESRPFDIFHSVLYHFVDLIYDRLPAVDGLRLRRFCLSDASKRCSTSPTPVLF